MTRWKCCGDIDAGAGQRPWPEGPSDTHGPPKKTKNCYEKFEYTKCDECCGGEPGTPCTPTDWGGYCNNPGSENDFYYVNGKRHNLDEETWEHINNQEFQARSTRSLFSNEERKPNQLSHSWHRTHGGVSRYPRSSSTSHGSDKSEHYQDIVSEIAMFKTILDEAMRKMFIYFLMPVAVLILAYFTPPAIKFFKKYVPKKST